MFCYCSLFLLSFSFFLCFLLFFVFIVVIFCYFSLFVSETEIVRPPYIVVFSSPEYELIAYKLQLVDAHITILCIFILS